VFLGALQYSPPLWKKMEECFLFSAGDREEVEIRGNSIWSVEVHFPPFSRRNYSCIKLIKRRMEEILREQSSNESTNNSVDPLNSVVIDFFLWGYAKKHSREMEHIPIHRVRGIFY
jgi:hypothetical protein